MGQSPPIEARIAKRMRAKGHYWVFSQHDLSDLGSRSAIDLALHRMVKRGEIRRVLRGLYHRRTTSAFLSGERATSIDHVAEALARKFGWQIQPGGAAAENYLGLSTQVPAKTVYYSSGPSRAYLIGRTTLTFKRMAAKEASFKFRESAVIVRALRSRRRVHITDADIEKIRGWLPRRMRPRVIADTRTATDWVHATIKKICRADDERSNEKVRAR